MSAILDRATINTTFSAVKQAQRANPILANELHSLEYQRRHLELSPGAEEALQELNDTMIDEMAKVCDLTQSIGVVGEEFEVDSIQW